MSPASAFLAKCVGAFQQVLTLEFSRACDGLIRLNVGVRLGLGELLGDYAGACRSWLAQPHVRAAPPRDPHVTKQRDRAASNNAEPCKYSAHSGFFPSAAAMRPAPAVRPPPRIAHCSALGASPVARQWPTNVASEPINMHTPAIVVRGFLKQHLAGCESVEGATLHARAAVMALGAARSRDDSKRTSRGQAVLKPATA